MIFRYDNVPHHSEIKSFPDHKHIIGRVISCKAPTLKEVLMEISGVLT